MGLLNDVGGFNANRRIFEEGTEIGEEILGARGTLDLPGFQVAVVVDVYSNPKKLSKDELEELKSNTTTPELIDRMPKNSVLARVITRNQDRYNSSPRVFFPTNVFDAEPIKPGEQVFVFFVDQVVNDQIGYWWKRVPQPIDTDDLNFTHADRKYVANDDNSTTDKLRGVRQQMPGFSNGGETDESLTLSGKNAYEEINKNAKANKEIVKEPVARFTKRPGDKVLMGSNASRIVLGTDRSGPTPTASDAPVRPKSATIDMVVGYGREGTPTAPTTVVNSRSEQEVDKRPSTPDNALEGDPDMVNDPSRFYLSEDTDPDTNFVVAPAGIPPTPGTAPSAVLRSDRIRVLANGDIKIVGNNNAIIMDSAGNITIIGNNIKIGSAASSLGVARLTDKASADINMNLWISSVSSALSQIVSALQAAGIGASLGPTPTPPSDFGVITKASTKVFSD